MNQNPKKVFLCLKPDLKFGFQLIFHEKKIFDPNITYPRTLAFDFNYFTDDF